MPNKTAQTRKSYFGLAALITAVVSGIFLAANYEISQLNITPSTFNKLNNWTALAYCVTAPIVLILSFLGYRAVHDSRKLSLFALGLVGVPFLVIFSRFVLSFLR